MNDEQTTAENEIKKRKPWVSHGQDRTDTIVNCYLFLSLLFSLFIANVVRIFYVHVCTLRVHMYIKLYKKVDWSMVDANANTHLPRTRECVRSAVCSEHNSSKAL